MRWIVRWSSIAATALAVAGVWAASLPSADAADGATTGGTPRLSATLPIEVILIMQDAEALKREHARMGIR